MTRDIWIGIELAEGSAQGWRFDAGTVLDHATGRNESEVAARLGKWPALIVGGGADAQAVPARALPEALPMTALTQDSPRGHLCPAARLRVAGVLSRRKDWEGVICVAMAEVTHWCQISAGEIVSFQSALTGRLARALGAGGGPDPQAISDTISRPERLAVHLRAAELAGDVAALAGHLAGAELAAMRPYWLGQQVIVIGRDALCAAALETQGVPVEIVSAEEAARDGLLAARGCPAV